MYNSRDKGERSPGEGAQSLHSASSPCSPHTLAAQSVRGCGWGRRHPPWLYHIKSSTQYIFLTLFYRSTAHELFLTLFQVLLDFILQFPGSSILESTYINSNIHTWPRRREENTGRQGWGRQGVVGERPWRNTGHGQLVETYHVGPQCAQKKWYMHNFTSRSMDDQRSFSCYATPLPCSDLRP